MTLDDTTRCLPLERIRKSDASQADKVDKLCNQIRDTDVNAKDAWNAIKSRLRDLNNELGG